MRLVGFIFVVSSFVGLLNTSAALARAKRKLAGHCISAIGEVVPAIKLRDECIAPNKWVKLNEQTKTEPKKSVDPKITEFQKL